MVNHENMIMTVRGPISPAALGVTMPHEHVICDISRHSGKINNLLNDVDLAAQELGYFREAGGGTIVDVTTEDIGRDAAALKRVSELSGVNLIVCTSYYAEELYPEYLRKMDVDQIAAHIVNESVNGIGDTGIRPGIIGELRSNTTAVTPAEERVLRASGRAHRETGLPVTLHSGYGRPAPNQLRILMEESVRPQRVIVGHADLVWDPDINKDFDYYRSMLQTGAYLEFDTIGWPGNISEDLRLDRICLCLEKGYAKQLLLSLDICRRSFYRANGGHGYDHVLSHFIPQLKARGVSDAEVRAMLIENPKNVLEIKL